VVELALSKDTSCARTRAGHVLCWGDDAFLTFAMSASEVPAPRRLTPTEVVGVQHAVELSIGPDHGCARHADGSVKCWLDPTDAFLGAPGGARVLIAKTIVELGHAEELASSRGQTCARRADGSLPCFDFSTRKADPEKSFPEATHLAIGGVHACVLTRRRTVACWGGSGMGQLGGAVPGGEVPDLRDVDELVAGNSYTCARTGGAVWCWGSNGMGQAGQPASSEVIEKPRQVPGVDSALQVAAGAYHTCARLAGGGVTCWGDDRFGQLGAGALQGLRDVVEIAVGDFHSCALRSGGTVMCWGRNQRGQLGDGTSTDRRSPVEVRF
jgi:alpha-tubulin suppressor-like RCC1 family protein